LCHFFEENNACGNLSLAISDERKHSEIKHTVALLRKLKKPSMIKDMVLNILEDELKYIIPDERIYIFSKDIQQNTSALTSSYIKITNTPERKEGTNSFCLLFVLNYIL